MNKILKNKTTLGIACIMLSLIISFALIPIFNDAMEAKVEVVRVSENIKEGEMITPGMSKNENPTYIHNPILFRNIPNTYRST